MLEDWLMMVAPVLLSVLPLELWSNNGFFKVPASIDYLSVLFLVERFSMGSLVS